MKGHVGYGGTGRDRRLPRRRGGAQPGFPVSSVPTLRPTRSGHHDLSQAALPAQIAVPSTPAQPSAEAGDRLMDGSRSER